MHEVGRWGWVAGALVLAGGGCGSEAGSGTATPGSPGEAGSWRQLPAPPLSGRVGALVAGVGNRIVVAGGWNFSCPPNADCATPDGPPYADGAAYDLDAGRWTSISDAPMALRTVVAAVAGDDVYALSQCALSSSCPAAGALLRYRSGADEWDQLPGPDAAGSYALVAALDSVVAYSQSDERGSSPDYRLLATEDRWVVLPDDPLPPVYDRFVVEYAGRLLLFGTPLGGADTRTKLAAAYDPETDAWSELSASGTLGFQVWRAGSSLYLNPHFRGAGGGIYDPDVNRWRPLPDPPYHDLAGIIGSSEATYEYPSGWVLDTRSGRWLEIEARPDTRAVYDETTTAAPDQQLVVFGGQTWSGGAGQLVNDTWLWTPPTVGAR